MWNWIFVVSLVLAVVFGLVLLWIWGLYNKLVIKRNEVKTDLSDIDIQLKRKADLAQRLVDMVREYAKHENETFTKVAEARSAVNTAKSAKETAKAENLLTDTLRSLMVVVESHPKLVASENFHGLRDDLKEIEDRIALYREQYNETTQSYNNAVMIFPNLMVAKFLGFEEAQLFEA